MSLTRRALLQGLLGVSLPCAAYAGGTAERVEIAPAADSQARTYAARVTLIGEAAHVVPPIGAQGLNMGLRDAADIAELGGSFAGEALFAPKGCTACNATGYLGRTGIYELLTIDEEAKRLIHKAESEQALRAHVTAQGMRGLRQDGLRWVLSGVTALEEVGKRVRFRTKVTDTKWSRQ